MKSVFLAGAVRTPIGKFGGAFDKVTAVELGTIAAKEAMICAGIKADVVDELIFGNARQAGSGPNPARQIAHKAGIPFTAPAFTVNKACGSALKSIIHAYQAIVFGDDDVVLAGGTENMSRVPFMIEDMRWGFRMGHQTLLDGMYRDGFLCPLSNMVMGETAEKLAEIYGISREEQDRYATQSQNRCEAAKKKGLWKEEIVPVPIAGKKGETTFVENDEHPRDGVTVESMAKLPPVFKKGGTIHAGNSSGITDGAAAIVVVSEEKAKKLGVNPMARIVAYTTAGVDPTIMGIGPVPVVKKLLANTKLTLKDIDLIEVNEAFAAQVLACDRELHFDMEKTNVNGGAIALGHPIGCTGARIVVTLLHEMKRRKSRYGLATLCISGGMGMAMLLESV
ncbi:MAG: acetyl-CoA C-acetyltransferase [Acidobacteriota bacterium]